MAWRVNGTVDSGLLDPVSTAPDSRGHSNIFTIFTLVGKSVVGKLSHIIINLRTTVVLKLFNRDDTDLVPGKRGLINTALLRESTQFIEKAQAIDSTEFIRRRNKMEVNIFHKCRRQCLLISYLLHTYI